MNSAASSTNARARTAWALINVSSHGPAGRALGLQSAVMIPPQDEDGPQGRGYTSSSDRAMRETALLQVALVVFFRAVELRRRLDLRHDRPPKASALI